jgi:hypothetical protein
VSEANEKVAACDVYDMLKAIVRSMFPSLMFHVPVRYRVIAVKQGGAPLRTRVDLQPINRHYGVPSLNNVDMLPGVAGCVAKLTPGSEVLVSFVEGDPSQPMITHYSRQATGGWIPLSLDIDAAAEIVLNAALIRLGKTATLPVIRAGDMAGPYPNVPSQVQVIA